MSEIEDKVCAKIQQRADVGMQKYGVSTMRTDYSFADWLTEFQQEQMDAAIYAERMLMDIADIRDRLAALRAFVEACTTCFINQEIQAGIIRRIDAITELIEGSHR